LVFAYAGQVVALDHCVGALLEALDAIPEAAHTLLLVTSSRGFPLGEHLHVGSVGDAPYQELLHVPCMLRFPDQLAAAVRSQSLWQPHHLPATIGQWLLHESPAAGASLQRLATGQCDYLTQQACAVTPGHAALRTPGWFVCLPWQQHPSPAATTLGELEPAIPRKCQLFVKPDDRWDFNDVATLCPELAERMCQQLALFQNAAAEGTLEQLAPLPDELVRHRG
jgi:arylsulfatase A-like enzyme